MEACPVPPFRLRVGAQFHRSTRFQPPSLKFRTSGFPTVRLQASGTPQFGTEPSAAASRLRLTPPCPRSDTAFTPPFDDTTHRLIVRHCVRKRRLHHRHLSPEVLALTGLCCPRHQRLATSSASQENSVPLPGSTGYRRGP